MDRHGSAFYLALWMQKWMSHNTGLYYKDPFQTRTKMLNSSRPPPVCHNAEKTISDCAEQFNVFIWRTPGADWPTSLPHLHRSGFPLLGIRANEAVKKKKKKCNLHITVKKGVSQWKVSAWDTVEFGCFKTNFIFRVGLEVILFVHRVRAVFWSSRRKKKYT